MKKIIFILIIVFTGISCKTTNLVSKVKRLEIGMTKKKVASVMGKEYQMLSASKTPEGNLEVISYSISPDRTSYIMYFLDGELLEWKMKNLNAHHHALSYYNELVTYGM